MERQVYLGFINDTAIPVAEAAKDFLKLLDWVECQQESAILTREGKPVAMLNLLPAPAPTGAELAERCSQLVKLPPDEANALADDLELARRQLPPIKSAWD